MRTLVTLAVSIGLAWGSTSWADQTAGPPGTPTRQIATRPAKALFAIRNGIARRRAFRKLLRTTTADGQTYRDVWKTVARKHGLDQHRKTLLRTRGGAVLRTAAAGVVALGLIGAPLALKAPLETRLLIGMFSGTFFPGRQALDFAVTVGSQEAARVRSAKASHTEARTAVNRDLLRQAANAGLLERQPYSVLRPPE